MIFNPNIRSQVFIILFRLIEFGPQPTLLKLHHKFLTVTIPVIGIGPAYKGQMMAFERVVVYWRLGLWELAVWVHLEMKIWVKFKNKVQERKEIKVRESKVQSEN